MIQTQIQNGNDLYLEKHLILVNCELLATFFDKYKSDFLIEGFLLFKIKLFKYSLYVCRLVHLPMTKASVRAMDVITQYLTSNKSPQEIQDLQSTPRFYEVG